MDPFALRRLTMGVIAWSCAFRLQQAVELMADGASFTRAFAVETFGPILLVVLALWRTGLLLRTWGDPLAGVAVTVGLGVFGVMVTQPMLRVALVELPAWLAGGAWVG